MSRWDALETADALRALSLPAPADPASMTRRRFLQASAATAGATALLPSWLADAAGAATPIGPADGVLVVILMGGGNDGLNTVVPTDDGRYYDARGSLAIGAEDALSLTTTTGLHPNLTRLHARYRAGQVALLRGVGDLDPDMSHFTAMARWMTGHAVSSGSSTGWLGRWLDGYGTADDLSAIVIGESIPLALVGAKRKATALPAGGVDAISADRDKAWIARSLDCIRDFGAAPTGNGAWADAIAGAGRGAVGLADVVEPVYTSPLPEGKLLAQLELAARLVNADLGVRVLQVQYGDFDHHAGQAAQHDARMAELDAGIDRFFSTLSPAFAGRTTILTLSEFGRRPEANSSAGTDHGESSDIMAIGRGVRGGIYGDSPDLEHLSEHGCPIAQIDFRSVYATVLRRWLDADAEQVLGGRFDDLGFLAAPSR